jgi:thymidine kinase
MLGETEEYEPLSRAAFYKAKLEEKIKSFPVDSGKLNSKK